MPLVLMTCLANSTKLGGRCFAGVVNEDERLRWVRPLGASPSGEVRMNEYRLDDGSDPELLDVIELELGTAAPTDRQPENWRLGPREWRRIRRLSRDESIEMLDTLLLPGEMLFGTADDRIAVETLDQAPAEYSLTVVRPRELRWHVTTGFRGGRQVRANFAIGSTGYDLVVTDPEWVGRLSELGMGFHTSEELGPRAEILLTVSLADELPALGACFKLVAAVFSL